MTTTDVLLSLVRRWYVVLLGLAATVCAVVVIATPAPVYTAQANVLFLAPATPVRPNALESASSGTIATAGLVEQLVNAGVEGNATVSDVTLLGQGVTDGWSVVLPNSGGQWAQNFDKPLLRVQVVGSSAEGVRSEMQRVVAHIEDVARALQDDVGVADGSRIQTELSPAVPVVQQAAGRRLPALVFTLALGLVLTAAAASAFDRVARRVGRSGISPIWRARLSEKSGQLVHPRTSM